MSSRVSAATDGVPLAESNAPKPVPFKQPSPEPKVGAFPHGQVLPSSQNGVPTGGMSVNANMNSGLYQEPKSMR